MRRTDDTIGLGEGAPRFFEHYAAGVGELDAALGAPKQFNAQFVFELPNLLAERWLCDMQVRRRTAEMQFVRDGHEIAQMTKFHI